VSPPGNDGGPVVRTGPTTNHLREAIRTTHVTALISSQQVSWWSVHEYVADKLAPVQSWPTLGTPAWCLLDDDDPRKLAALVDAAQHWALRLETCQEASCEASRAVSAAADWSQIAAYIRAERDFYAARPWLKRVAS
jgi:hypothetical protein